jgi:hypothetical protein
MMHPDKYRSILANHELVAYDHVKRRVGSQAILASEELSDIEIDIKLHQLSDEEYAALRAQEDEADFTPMEHNDPVFDAQVSFDEEVARRFGDVDGYLLSAVNAEAGLFLVKIASEEGSDLSANFLNLSYSYTPDAEPQISKIRRASTHSGERIKETLTVTDDDVLIIEEAFSRLASINEALENE